MHPVTAYLTRLHEIHTVQDKTPELSYRGALENLLNALGQGLDSAVQVTPELGDTGSGHPDYGIYEKDSGARRGVVEVKPVLEAARRRAGEQCRGALK